MRHVLVLPIIIERTLGMVIYVATELLQGNAQCLIGRHKQRLLTDQQRRQWVMSPNENECARCGSFYGGGF